MAVGQRQSVVRIFLAYFRRRVQQIYKIYFLRRRPKENFEFLMAENVVVLYKEYSTIIRIRLTCSSQTTSLKRRNCQIKSTVGPKNFSFSQKVVNFFWNATRNVVKNNRNFFGAIL